MLLAIYPGSFDPITSGHLDLIERGAMLFPRLIVAVMQNEGKAPLFSVAERMEMLRQAVGHVANVEVDCFEGLLVRGIETVFLMAREAHSFVSSRLVKEVSRLGGDVRGLVPEFVEERLRQKRSR